MPSRRLSAETRHAILAFVVPGSTFIIDAPESQAMAVAAESRRERQKQAARRFRDRRKNLLESLQDEAEELRRAVAVLRGRNEALQAMLYGASLSLNDNAWLA